MPGEVSNNGGEFGGRAGKADGPGFDQALGGMGIEGFERLGLATMGKNPASAQRHPFGRAREPFGRDGPTVEPLEGDAGGEGWGMKEFAANRNRAEEQTVLAWGPLASGLGFAEVDEGVEQFVDLVEAEFAVPARAPDFGERAGVAGLGQEGDRYGLKGGFGHGMGSPPGQPSRRAAERPAALTTPS